MFSAIITLLFVCSTLALAAAGGSADVLFTGAHEAVSFCIGIAGGICLWSAVMELMEDSGIAQVLSRAMRPVLSRLFPHATAQPQVLSALCENVSANLLGLGNAATPAGIRAAKGMAVLGEQGADELCMLVVLNTASIQLLPTTIAAVRSGYGAASAFDILPAVWISSGIALTVGFGTAAMLRRLWR